MTLQEAIKNVRIWLDEASVYHSERTVRLALKRSLLAYLNQSADRFETDAEARTRLVQLTAAPAAGAGPVAEVPFLEVLRITAVELTFGSDVQPVGASPISQQALAEATRSYFKKPTDRAPRYSEARAGARRRLTFHSTTTPTTWRVFYLAMPPNLLTAALDVALPLAETDAEVVVQQTVRSLMAQKEQAYAVQAQVESQETT